MLYYEVSAECSAPQAQQLRRRSGPALLLRPPVDRLFGIESATLAAAMYLSSSFLLLPFLLTATATTAAASSLTVTVPPSNLLPNPHALPAGTHATLTTLPSSSSSSAQKHILSAPLTRSSTFVFRDLDASRPGGESYLLDIRSRDYVFAPFRVDIAADGTVLGIWETFRGNSWDNRGVERFVATSSGGQSREDVTVEAKVVARRGFYEERPRCKFRASRVFVCSILVFCYMAFSPLGMILIYPIFYSLSPQPVQESNDSACCVCTRSDVRDAETYGE